MCSSCIIYKLGFAVILLLLLLYLLAWWDPLTCILFCFLPVICQWWDCSGGTREKASLNDVGYWQIIVFDYNKGWNVNITNGMHGTSWYYSLHASIQCQYMITNTNVSLDVSTNISTCKHLIYYFVLFRQPHVALEHQLHCLDIKMTYQNRLQWYLGQLFVHSGWLITVVISLTQHTCVLTNYDLFVSTWTGADCNKLQMLKNSF